MKEVLDYYKPKIQKSSILNDLDLKEKNYFLVSIHREENVDNEENLLEMIQSLRDLVSAYQVPVIVSTHPRTKKRIESYGIKESDGIRFLKPFVFWIIFICNSMQNVLFLIQVLLQKSQRFLNSRQLPFGILMKDQREWIPVY